VFDVEIAIPNGDGRLRPGMIGAVSIVPETTAAAGRPAVPLAAVVRADKGPDQYTVFVVAGPDSDAVARSRAVTLGAIEGNLVAVTSGVEPGERVVVMGATLLKDGDTVRVIP
jgi:multidrug efflux pump subunit AcrA (membrane-fusion protein)